jgi:hypothetical protein
VMLSKGKRPYDPEVLEPRTRLRRNVEDLFGSNRLSATRISEICSDVRRIDEQSFPGLRPSTPRNAKRDLLKLFRKRSTWLPVYWAEVRCLDPKTQEVKPRWLAIRPLHEIVHVLGKHGIRSKLMEREGMDPLTREHLEFCDGEAGCELLGLGIWTDGTPCNWDRSESIETLCVSLPGLTGEWKNLRVPITAIPKKYCTQETWDDVFAVVKWCLQILATGVWPTCRHDGAPWRASDTKRKAPKPFIRSALVEVRADWDCLAFVYGFPRHNLLEGMCWECSCTPEQARASCFLSGAPILEEASF